EAAIAVYTDNNRNWSTHFQTLGLSVKCLTEFHDVHTVLTQSRTNWWTWVCFARCNLQLDIGGYFLCHLLDSPLGVNASGALFGLAHRLRLPSPLDIN